MLWVTGKLKYANGNIASPDTLASKVFMEDGNSVDNVIENIDIAQEALSTELTNLRLAATSLANTVANMS